MLEYGKSFNVQKYHFSGGCFPTMVFLRLKQFNVVCFRYNFRTWYTHSDCQGRHGHRRAKKGADWYFAHCYFHSVSLICIHPCLCPRNSGPGIKLDKWFYLNLRILWTKERGQLTLNTWQNWRFWFDSQSDAVLKSNIQHFGHESLWTNISILLLFPQPCFNFLTENLVSHKSWLIMVTQTTYLTALSSGNFMMSCKKRPSWSG